MNNAILSWDAGADSIERVAADASCVFNMYTGNVGCIIGFKEGQAGIRVTVPGLITHGFYFQAFNGQNYWQVIESGQPIGGTNTYVETDTFEIRRVGGQVTYRYNGAVVYTSSVPSNGVVFLNTCLYASGDQAPASTGGTLAASFSFAATPGFSDDEHLTFADTSEGENIVWRSWSFAGVSPQLIVIPTLPNDGDGEMYSVYQPIQGSTFTTTWSTLAAFFPSASGTFNVTLTIYDSNGNTSSATQPVTLPL